MRVNKKKRQAYRPSDHVVSRESAVSSILGAITGEYCSAQLRGCCLASLSLE